MKKLLGSILPCQKFKNNQSKYAQLEREKKSIKAHRRYPLKKMIFVITLQIQKLTPYANLKGNSDLILQLVIPFNSSFQLVRILFEAF